MSDAQGAPRANPAAGTAKPIRVLVADDQALIRRGIALLLSTADDVEVVGQAADGIEALELSRTLKPDVVLMDLQMPRCSGVAATRAIVAEMPTAQVVVLTTFDSDDLVFDAIRAGAQAYLLKDASEADLLDTIRAVSRGEARLAPNIAQKVIREFRNMPTAQPLQAAPSVPSAAAAEAADDSPSADALTKREEQILEFIAQGMNNKAIARAVNLAEGTVRNYVSRIMEKLHARTRTELAVKAVRDKKL